MKLFCGSSTRFPAFGFVATSSGDLALIPRFTYFTHMLFERFLYSETVLLSVLPTPPTILCRCQVNDPAD